MTARNIPGEEKKLRVVGKGVFNRVVIKVLIHTIAAEMTATDGLRPHRPCVFHPTAAVDEVDIGIAETAAAGPKETMEPADLPQQFVLAGGLGAGKQRAHRTVFAIGPHRKQVANFAVMNAMSQILRAPGCDATSTLHPP